MSQKKNPIDQNQNRGSLSKEPPVTPSDESFEVESSDGSQNVSHRQRRKRKHHRHSSYQIQELEALFKDCPHPDGKQRADLTKRLGLGSKQIKFWFQNRRTQLKNQLERQENLKLKDEIEKLRAENDFLKGAMKCSTCNNCGGTTIIPGDVSYEQHQMRLENTMLRDELARICNQATKLLEKSRPPSSTPILNTNYFTSNTRMQENMVSGPKTGIESDSFQSCELLGSYPSSFMELALTAMEELIKMASLDSPFWVRSPNGEMEIFNEMMYKGSITPIIGPKPLGFRTEASRETTFIMRNSFSILETLMDVHRWADTFSSIVCGATTMEVISCGINGSNNGGLQMMQAEFQVLTPLVPLRQVTFLRYCKQQSEDTWAVVDVSIDLIQKGSCQHSYIRCRRLPSGCVIQDHLNGLSKVTWVEHLEYDASLVLDLCKPMMKVGIGAKKWVRDLQRDCERLALMTYSIDDIDHHLIGLPNGSWKDIGSLSIEGRGNLLDLAKRMTRKFCATICHSSVYKWEKLTMECNRENFKIMMRQNVNSPDEPTGLVIGASTSFWIPLDHHTTFGILQEERNRIQWDILSNGSPMHEVINLAKPELTEDRVMLFQAVNVDGSPTNLLVLQETWTDDTVAMIVYTPMDTNSMNVLIGGGDTMSVAILPSGLVILPCSPSFMDGTSSSSRTREMPQCSTSTMGFGCILTASFQILMSSRPTTKLSMESIKTINNLICSSIQKIKNDILGMK